MLTVVTDIATFRCDSSENGLKDETDTHRRTDMKRCHSLDLDQHAQGKLDEAALENKKREWEIRVRVARHDEHPVDSNGRPLLFVEDTSECPVCREPFETVAVYQCGHFLCGECHGKLVNGDFPFVSDPNHCIVCKDATPRGSVIIHKLALGRHNTSASFSKKMNHAHKWTVAPPPSSVSESSQLESPREAARVRFLPMLHPDDASTSALIVEIPTLEDTTETDVNRAVFHFLIDVSGSMSDFLTRLRSNGTLHQLTQRLIGCFVSFSKFSDDVITVIPPVLVQVDNAESISAKLLDGLHAEGRTALHLGIGHLRTHMLPEMTRVLGGESVRTREHLAVILTDGEADCTQLAADEFRQLEATCSTFLLGVGENYSFDACDQIVRRDTTKYAHIDDEATLVDHMCNRADIQRLFIRATAEDSLMYYNGNVTSPVDGVHELVLRRRANEKTSVVFTNVDEKTLTRDDVPVEIQRDVNLGFSFHKIIHTTIALAHIKDLSLGVSHRDMYASIHALACAKSVIRSFGVGLGASYADLMDMIDTQVSMFTRMLSSRAESVERGHSSNTTARLATFTALRAYTAMG